jgi:hypothetical protein
MTKVATVRRLVVIEFIKIPPFIRTIPAMLYGSDDKWQSASA